MKKFIILKGVIDVQTTYSKRPMVSRMIPTRQIDPGPFSLMEPGWWALHATAITGVYLLGSKLRNRI